MTSTSSKATRWTLEDRKQKSAPIEVELILVWDLVIRPNKKRQMYWLDVKIEVCEKAGRINHQARLAGKLRISVLLHTQMTEFSDGRFHVRGVETPQGEEGGIDQTEMIHRRRGGVQASFGSLIAVRRVGSPQEGRILDHGNSLDRRRLRTPRGISVRGRTRGRAAETEVTLI